MLEIIDLQRIKHVKLDDGRLADGLTVHELRRAVKRMGLEVGPDHNKQDILISLHEHRKAQEAAARKRQPYNSAEATISAAKTRGECA